MWAALLLAFLPGTALMLVYVWTMIPADWFSALYGNSAGAGRGTIVAQVLTPCPTPRATLDDPATPRPATAQPQQQHRTVAPRAIPRQDRSPHAVARRKERPDAPATGRPPLIAAGSRSTHLPSPSRNTPLPGAVHRSMWVQQPARRTFFMRLDAGDTDAGHRCAGHHPDGQGDDHDVRDVHLAFPVNAGRARDTRGWEQEWPDHQAPSYVVA